MNNIASGDLRKVQLMELDILTEVDRVCRKLDLRYYVIAGTLLGAVRHKGFIPWDSDIDIAMFRDEYEMLITQGNDLINDRFFIQSDHSDVFHKSTLAKVRANGTLYIEKGNKIKGSNNGFYIDVFPLDDIRTEPGRIDYLNAKFIRLLQRVKAFRKGKYCSTTLTRTIAAFFLSFPTLPIPITVINKFIRARMTKDNGKGYPYVTNYCSKYGIIRQFMPKDIYGTPVEIEFEGKRFPAPEKYLVWLEKIYGENYMRVPEKHPITNRISDAYIYDLGPYK